MAIKVGFIGCGFIALTKHLPGMSQEKDVEMAAFCDIIVEKAEKAKKEFGTSNSKVYTDYKTLIADPTIDVIHVLTPNASHAEITIAALEAGKHVMCEKPMAATSADAKKMLEARDRTGKLLTIGYQYRHYNENQVAKKVIDEGYLGDIYYSEASYIRRRGVPTWGVFTDKAQQGGGALIDIATHVLDLSLFMMNNYDVDYVVGTSFEKLGKMLTPEQQGQTNMFRHGMQDPWNNETFEVEEFAVGYIKMKNGAVIHLKSSWALNMADTPAQVLLCGTKGGLDTTDSRVRLNHIVAGQQSITMVGDKVAPYVPGFSSGEPPPSLEAQYWVNAIKGEGDLFVTADQAYVVTRILEAIYDSSKTGKAIHF
ncbi:MAG: Gfo/Idh/MocA family oxidoreductase [Defluviitaleaceae bacterium]|nr:Gfo/Idh/MocA family oxidoreductase [Defluviitaleaceae bacterium]